MAANSPIEWTDATWSPLRVQVKPNAAEIARTKGYTSLIQIAEKMAGRVGPHCEHCSDGCDNCYAETNNGRCLPSNGTGLPFDRRSRDLVNPFVDEGILRQPAHWKTPKRIFVENQSDLFGEWVPDADIDRVVGVMAWCYLHTYQVLTKRARRMREYSEGLLALSRQQRGVRIGRSAGFNLPADTPGGMDWPLPNVWFGVSAEDQPRADERIPELLRTPAAVRFISGEPLLSGIRLHDEWLLQRCPECKRLMRRGWRDCPAADCDGHPSGGLDQVIAGGESGAGARPCKLEWARSLRDQCQAAGVPFFWKQWGAWLPPMCDGNGHLNCSDEPQRVGKKAAGRILDGRTWDEFPVLAGASVMAEGSRP